MNDSPFEASSIRVTRLDDQGRAMADRLATGPLVFGFDPAITDEDDDVLAYAWPEGASYTVTLDRAQVSLEAVRLLCGFPDLVDASLFWDTHLERGTQ